MNSNQNKNFSQKLKVKLKELFQFDSSDLDFGIYRIMNYKRKEIEDFIENDLIEAVEKEFKKYKTQNYKELIEKIEEKERKIKEDFGDYIFTNGKLKEKYGETKLVSEYLELKKKTEDTDITESIQSQTFNDLYNFFSRYYEDGDFISKRRYSSKNYKYAIPYNGEEVKLYWANFDQYYIKTGEIFKDYVFTQKGWRFIFKTTTAEVEVGNVKGERRYFFLSPDKPIDIKDNTCPIQFEYKLLTDEDLIEYSIKTKDGKLKKTGITQDDLNAILKDKIIDSISLPEPKKFLLEKQNGKTILEKHLYKFTRKITSDFFIHKDLKGFLERELDYFIKTEVLDIDSLDTEKQRYFDRHITRSKVVKNIGKKIIEFLAQIEDFQKTLWEKKKFILRTDYVITIDRIPEEFHLEIINNKEQLEEWEELGFGEINKKEDLMAEEDLFNTKYKKLPVDTKYFNQDFKERLLEKLTEKDNLDDLIDGVLIKSENWQALNLLLEKYKEKTQCVYIDPPFNSKTTEILYKNFYKHSSWLSLMENRISIGKQLLEDKGVFICAIDENEQERLGQLLEYIFPFKEKTCISVVHNPRGIQGENFSYCHEFAYFIYPNKAGIIGKEKRKTGWRNLRDNGGESERRYAKNCFYPIFIEEGKIMGFGDVPPRDYHPQVKSINNKEIIEIWPIDSGCIERKWRYARNSVEKVKHLLRAIERQGTWEIQIKKEEYRYRTVWADSKYDSNEYGSKLLNNIMGGSTNFTFPKSLYNVLDCVNAGTQNYKHAIILDFFAGSGTTAHAVMKLNKEDGGKRKYMLVEMAEYFDTVVIPRIKKVCYSFNWKDGKPQDGDGTSQIIKYHYLEQYEDTLHNIEFPQEEKGQRILELLPEGEKSEYLVKYMLKFETEGSPSLLNLKKFTNPFEYKLKIISGNNKEEIVNVDLVETFNYLIGLKINKYRYLTDNGRKYVFVLGERNYRKVVIVWRSTVDIDLEKDKKIINEIINDFNPEEIYINGDSLVKNYKPIESEFKSRAGV
jgi:adenine-specific DNA-methyltransferase